MVRLAQQCAVAMWSWNILAHRAAWARSASTAILVHAAVVRRAITRNAPLCSCASKPHHSGVINHSIATVTEIGWAERIVNANTCIRSIGDPGVVDQPIAKLAGNNARWTDYQSCEANTFKLDITRSAAGVVTIVNVVRTGRRTCHRERVRNCGAGQAGSATRHQWPCG